MHIILCRAEIIDYLCSLKFKTMKHSVYYIPIILILTLLYSCEKPAEQPSPPYPVDNYSNGMLIMNEGPFQTGTGTVSFWCEGTEIQNKIFQENNNGLELGNIVQSATVIGLNTFIVVNNSNKIRIVDKNSFKFVSSINEIELPRYVIQSDDGHAYVSCWDNTVKIINLAGYKVTGAIQVGTGPERMLKVNEKVWVLNRGGYSTDSVISVIDISTATVEKTLEVYPKPAGIVADKNEKVWIICSGYGWNGVPSPGDSKGHLLCIDPFSYEIITDIEFSDIGKHPEQLIINDEKDILYYNYPDGVYKFNITSTSVENEPLISHTTMFYGLAYSDAGNVIYCTDPVDYAQNGWVYKYSAETGAVLDSAKAGVIPGNMIFAK